MAILFCQKKPDGWLHSPVYIDKNAVFNNSAALHQLSMRLISNFYWEHIDCIVGPESGGAQFAEYIARHLSKYPGPGRGVVESISILKGTLIRLNTASQKSFRAAGIKIF